jgi:hypothetical protein
MATLEFDKKFQKLTTEMVEIAFEYARVNKEEVDAILKTWTTFPKVGSVMCQQVSHISFEIENNK